MKGWPPDRNVCPTCHGSGKVYPADILDPIVRAIREADEAKATAHQLAVAILDVLNTTKAMI